MERKYSKSKEIQNSTREKEIETKHFQHNPIGIDDNEFLSREEKSLDKIKSLLLLGQVEIQLDNKGVNGSQRAVITKGSGDQKKIIFMTQWPDEIQELKDTMANKSPR